MKKIVERLIGLILLSTVHITSHALACQSDEYGTSFDDYIPQTIAVPLDLPINSILWRSETRTMTITCYQDVRNGSENAYFYLNPYNNLGENVELGVNVNGIDYRHSQVAKGRIVINELKFTGCSKDAGCPNVKKSFTLNSNYFVSKKVPPLAPGTPPEGPLADVPPRLIAFQIDGVNGMNSANGKNFQMWLTGLDNFRYVNCATTMEIYPSQINFRTAFAHKAQANKKIEEQPFYVKGIKQCENTAPYGLNISFSPSPTGTASADKSMLIPNDNDSVGIRIWDTMHDMPIKLNSAYEFKPASDMESIITRKFQAQLIWATSTAKAGPFNAGLLVDFYYK